METPRPPAPKEIPLLSPLGKVRVKGYDVSGQEVRDFRTFGQAQRVFRLKRFLKLRI
jgi:hypothetical protein